MGPLEAGREWMMLTHLCMRHAYHVFAAHRTAQLHVPRRAIRHDDDGEIQSRLRGMDAMRQPAEPIACRVTHRGGARCEGRSDDGARCHVVG